MSTPSGQQAETGGQQTSSKRKKPHSEQAPSGQASPGQSSPGQSSPGQSGPGQSGSGQPSPEHSGGLLPHVQPGDAPAQRGTLDIAPRAVERIAEGAAVRVPGVRPVSRRVGADRLQVQARVLGDTASVHLQVAVGYPSPVRETCRQVRSAVVEQVQRLAGVEVTRLDVQVVELQHRPGGTRRVR